MDHYHIDLIVDQMIEKLSDRERFNPRNVDHTQPRWDLVDLFRNGKPSRQRMGLVILAREFNLHFNTRILNNLNVVEKMAAKLGAQLYMLPDALQEAIFHDEALAKKGNKFSELYDKGYYLTDECGVVSPITPNGYKFHGPVVTAILDVVHRFRDFIGY